MNEVDAGKCSRCGVVLLEDDLGLCSDCSLRSLFETGEDDAREWLEGGGENGPGGSGGGRTGTETEPAPTSPEPAPTTPAGAPGPPGYRVDRLVARGGMGVVYLAEQLALGREVALKVLAAHVLSDRGAEDRFQVEAEAVAQLEHANIVPVYDVGRWDGRPFIAMRWIEGDSLAGWVDAWPAAAGEGAGGGRKARDGDFFRAAIPLLVQVAEAVHHAHQRGFLHRDLKPANILVDRCGTAYVTDFGLVRRLGDAPGATVAGEVLGTPAFMSPEQARGGGGEGGAPLTLASDVFSLGAVLYWLLAGDPPFRGETHLEVLRRLEFEEAALPEGLAKTVDRDLATVCLKCLRKDPVDRYASALELAQDLGRWQRGEPVRARRQSRRERLLGWARRRPALAALSALSATLAVSFVVYLTVSRSELKEMAEAAEASADLEARLRRAAERERDEADRLRGLADEAAARLAVRDLRSSARQAGELLSRAETNLALAALARLVRDNPRAGALASRLAGVLATRPLATVEVIGPGPHRPARAAVSPDGRFIAYRGPDRRAWVYDRERGEHLRGSRALTSWEAQNFSFSADGLRLAVGAQGTEAAGGATFVLPSGERLASAPGVGERSAKVRLSPDGRVMVVWRARVVVFWDVGENRQIGRIALPDPVPNLKWAPDSRRVFLTTSRRGLRRVDLPGLGLTELRGNPWPPLQDFAVGPGGDRLLLNEPTGLVVRAAQNGAAISNINLFERATCWAFDPSGKLIAVGASSGQVELLSADPVAPLRQGWNVGGAVSQLRFSTDGSRLLIVSGGEVADEGKAVVFALPAGNLISEGVRWSRWLEPDAEIRTAVTLDSDRRVVRWAMDPPAKRLVARSFTPNGRPAEVVRISPDGSRVACVLAGVELISHDFPRPEAERRLYHRFSPNFTNFDFSADGRALAAGATSLCGFADEAAGGEWKELSLDDGRLAFSGFAGMTVEDGMVEVSQDGRVRLIAPDGVERRRIQHTTTAVGAWSDRASGRIWLEQHDGQLAELGLPDLGLRRVIRVREAAEPRYREAGVSAGGRWFRGITRDGRLRVISLAPGSSGWVPGGFEPSAVRAEIDDDGGRIFYITPWGTGLVAGLGPEGMGSPVPLLGEGLADGRFARGGELLVTTSRHRLVEFWETASGLPSWEPVPLRNFALSLAPARDARHIVVGDVRGAVVYTVSWLPAEDPRGGTVWLADLAEAVGGLRQTEAGVVEPLDAGEVAARKAAVRRAFEGGDLPEWARRFLGGEG